MTGHVAPAAARGTARVVVPATSANLGPGYDALGLALALHDEVAARITTAGSSIEVSGEGSEEVARDERHLVVRAVRAGLDRLGVDQPGLSLRCRNAIPHGRGLGSSAAAIVAGLLLARALVPAGEAALPDADLLALAGELEGHPDNVAPCLLGGLTVAWVAGGRARAVQLRPHPGLLPVLLVPPFSSSTAHARGLLPPTVPHADAAFTAGRAALLMAALTVAPGELFAATEDRLHQQYRAPAAPLSAALVTELRSRGLPAVVSGAGPTVLVLARDEHEASMARSLGPDGWSVRELVVDAAGASVRDATP